MSADVSYDLLEEQVRALLAGESDFVANAANFAAFIYHALPEINWAGFYLRNSDGELVLGPFCGRPACTRLPPGRGVCGAAMTARSTIVVDDVSAFADHIVCDSASRSEIVVPFFIGGELAGVFDCDSTVLARFTPTDREALERLIAILSGAPLSFERSAPLSS